MSLYNAANARLASSAAATTAAENDYRYHSSNDAMGATIGQGHTHPGMQYALDSYIQLGYGLDNRPLQVAGYAGEMYGAPVPWPVLLPYQVTKAIYTDFLPLMV